MKTKEELIRELIEWDQESAKHCLRVSEFVLRFSSYLGYKGAELERIRTAALLHDIGKLKMPKEVLNDSKPMNEEKYSIIIRHPIDGFYLLKNAGFDDILILQSALFHHERVDLKGYPFGIPANAIQKEIRLITLCDAFDAITSQRKYDNVYRTKEETIREIDKGTGTQFDEQLAASLKNFLDTNIYDFKNKKFVS